MMYSEVLELHSEEAVSPQKELYSSGINAVDLLEQGTEVKPTLNHGGYSSVINKWPNLSGLKDEDLSSEDPKELTNGSSVPQTGPSSSTCVFLLRQSSNMSNDEDATSVFPHLGLPAPSLSSCQSWEKQTPAPGSSFMQDGINCPKIEERKRELTQTSDYVNEEEDLKVVEMLRVQTSEFGGNPTSEPVPLKEEHQKLSSVLKRISYWNEAAIPCSAARHEKDDCQGVDQHFKCEVCNKTFTSKIFLENHGLNIVEHTSDGEVHMPPHSLETHGQKGEATDDQKNHACSSHENGEYSSEWKVVETREKKAGDLFGRFNMVHGKKSFVCVVCGKNCSCPSMLKTHMMVHAEEKYQSCHLCDKKFTRAGSLRLHLMTVHDEGKKSFVCEVCGKGFGLFCHLTRHKRTHTKEKPFKCQHCHKRFGLRGNCKAHERIHTGERPYQCQYCQERFCRSSNCLDHEGAVHTKQNLHHCPICNKAFLYPSILKKHETSMHFKDGHP